MAKKKKNAPIDTRTHVSLSQGARARLIARGGKPTQAVRLGMPSRPFSDLFHAVLSMSRAKIFALILVLLAATNAVFAAAYMLDPAGVANARHGSFTDHFFFSVQTMATLGYGQMWPSGVYANALATIEAFFGLLAFAIVSAVLFTRLSRPIGKVMFSNVAVITRRNGKNCFMFRMANARGNQIIGGELTVTLLRRETTLEGETVRIFHDLPLARSHTPVLSLTWTAIHYIDDHSPLKGATPESLLEAEVEIVVLFTGIDETSSQLIHSRNSYIASEIKCASRFVDVVSQNSEGVTQIDYRNFHLTQPMSESARA